MARECPAVARDDPGPADLYLEAEVDMDEPTWRLSDVPDDIRSDIKVDPLCGCWRFTRGNPSNTLGHKRIRWRGKNWWVHRLVFTLLVGPIPPRLELDHVKVWGCRWNDCCWPGHLEPVTRAENIRRAAAAKTHCPQQHALVPGNLVPHKWRHGWRECLTCRREAQEDARLNRAPRVAERSRRRAERRATVVRLRTEGLTLEQIAGQVGITRAAVWNHLKQAGWPISRKPEPERRSQYNGVGWVKARGKWKAQFRGQFLGYFADEADAIQACEAAAREA